MRATRLTRPDDLGSSEFVDDLELALTNLGIEPGQVFFLAAPTTQEAQTRTTDPDTSRKAAATIADLNDNQRAVLRIFNSKPYPLSDEQLEQHYVLAARARVVPTQSPSGIRSRRSELRDEGFLVEAGKTKNSRGREVQLFAVPNS